MPVDPSRLCSCHGEPVYRQPSDGKARCRVRRNESRRVRRADGRTAAIYAEQLARGVKIADRSNHHKGMSERKRQLGDPRPEGLELSLVNDDSPDVYEGHDHKRGKRVPYRLSTNPADYRWETPSENAERKS